MYNGLINVYKEAGFTSFDVVAKLRGILGQKKIGHTGTLDPDATGVLPVVVGNATKLVEMLTDKQKEYVAEFVLGVSTDTQDISGEVTERRAVTCSEDDIRVMIDTFVGDIMQVPPMYSALKVDGKKLYELAREGKTVERKARPVTIYEIEILSVNMDGSIDDDANGADLRSGDAADTTAADAYGADMAAGSPRISIRVICSKGTYIRTLCSDIGEKLGCGATMTSLKRTMSGQFGIGNAHTLAEIEDYIKSGRSDEIITPTDAIFADLPKYMVKGPELKLVQNGNQIAIPSSDAKEIRIYSDTEFIALYEQKNPKQNIYKPKYMFL